MWIVVDDVRIFYILPFLIKFCPLKVLVLSFYFVVCFSKLYFILLEQSFVPSKPLCPNHKAWRRMMIYHISAFQSYLQMFLLHTIGISITLAKTNDINNTYPKSNSIMTNNYSDLRGIFMGYQLLNHLNMQLKELT